MLKIISQSEFGLEKILFCHGYVHVLLHLTWGRTQPETSAGEGLTHPARMDRLPAVVKTYPAMANGGV